MPFSIRLSGLPDSYLRLVIEATPTAGAFSADHRIASLGPLPQDLDQFISRVRLKPRRLSIAADHVHLNVVLDDDSHDAVDRPPTGG
jgi:hypothetical protein